jgi:hypothetical protein
MKAIERICLLFNITVEIVRKCCLLTAMGSKACLFGADENIFQVSVKLLRAEHTDTMIYLEWLSSSLNGNTQLA